MLPTPRSRGIGAVFLIVLVAAVAVRTGSARQTPHGEGGRGRVAAATGSVRPVSHSVHTTTHAKARPEKTARLTARLASGPSPKGPGH